MTVRELPPNELFREVEPAREEPLFPMIVGSLVAGACADALGWITEFMRSPAAIPRLTRTDQVTDYVGWRKPVGGRFNTYIDYIGPGEYSDDTQLTLAVARALGGGGEIDNLYFAKVELPAWLSYSRGAGRTITAAAQKARRSTIPWYRNFFTDGQLDYRASGANGAALRVSPIALAHLAENKPPLGQAFANSIVTHGHPRAHVGSLLLVAAIHEAARRRLASKGTDDLQATVADLVLAWDPGDTESPEIRSWLEEWNSGGTSYQDAYATTLGEIRQLLEPRHGDTRSLLEELGCFDRATKGSGTTTVAAAIHLVSRYGPDLETAVIEAVNAVPADTDTIGAFVGAIGGAYAGYEAIPERWTARLQDHGYFIAVGEALAEFASGDTDEISLRPRLLSTDRELPEIMQLLGTHELEVGLRVRHEVLGSGWIEAVHAQQIRRRGGGQIVYARVALDIGQHCQFRTYVPPKR